MERDIFKSEPNKGAVVTDATGPTAAIIVDLKTDIGSYHFEIPGGLAFTPSNELRLAPSGDQRLGALVAQISVRRG